MDEIPEFMCNLLKKTGYCDSMSVESFQWMSDITELYPFYDWLVNTITEDNVITRDELLCFNHMEKSGKLLSEDELDARINSFISTKPTLNLDDVNVEGLELMIDNKGKILNTLQMLQNRLSCEVANLESQSYDVTIDKLIADEEDRAKDVQQEYLKQFNILADKFEMLCNNMSSLDSNGEETIYFCQNSLKQFSITNSNLEIYIEMMKKKILKEDSASQSDVCISLDSPIFYSNDELMNKVFRWLTLEEFNCKLYAAKHSAAVEVLNRLSECDEQDVDNLIFFLNNKKKDRPSNCASVTLIKEEVLHKMFELCETYIKEVIRGTQLNICRERIERKQNRIALLNNLESVVKTRKLCNDCLHFFVMTEWKLVRASISLLEDTNNYWKIIISEFKKRMGWMKKIIIKQQIPSLAVTYCIEKETNQTFNSTVGFIDDSQDINKSSVLKMHNTLSQFKETMFNNYNQYSIEIRKINSDINKVDKFLFPSNTRRIQYNENIIYFLKEIENLGNSFSVENQVKKNQEQMAILETDNDLLHMMWYEWNKNPMDVINKILKMEQSAKIREKRLDIIINHELSLASFKESAKL